MKQKIRHTPKFPSGHRLRKTLDLIATTPAQSSFGDAGEFICPVCDFSHQPCKWDPKAKCFRMLREGTELQVLFQEDREAKRRCLECGKLLSRKALTKNPSAELCPSCTRKLVKRRTGSQPQRSLS